MKLTKRQTKIIIVSFFLAILIIPTSFIAIKNIRGGKEKKKVSIQPNSNEDTPDKDENDPTNFPHWSPPLIDSNSSLESARKANITSIEKLLTTTNVKEQDLLQKLKSDGKLNTSENDWRNYFNSATKISELRLRWTIVSNLIKNIPNGQNPPPSTPPSSPSTNKWKKILWEIKGFMNADPQTLQEVKDWIQAKKLNPLTGINLAGIRNEELEKMPNSGTVSGLDGVPETVEYKDYVQLPAAGDGNCFLHSFSVFLVGRSDVNLTLRLRVALCLELMTNPERYFLGLTTDKEKIAAAKDEINREGIAENTRWLNSDINKYLAHVLKRPIVSIIKSQYLASFQVYDYPNSETGEGSDFIPAYPEKWVIYNSGGHYQPLIKK